MILPGNEQRLVVGDRLDPVWRRFLASLTTQADLDAATSAIATALGSPDGTIAGIPEQTDETIRLIQSVGISITGTATDGYTIGLRQLNNSGSGELLKVTRDSYGRISGSASAWPDVMARISLRC